MSTQALRYAALIAMATGLAACNDGGGGGGGDSTTSESDDPEFAKDVPEDDATIDSDSADSTSSTSVDSASTTLEGSRESGDLAGKILKKAAQSQTKKHANGTRGSVDETYECGSSGEASYTGDYPGDDPYGDGANYSVQFNDCVMEAEGKTYNGAMDFELTGDVSQDSFSAKFTFDEMQATDGGDIVWLTHGDLTYTYAQYRADNVDSTPFTNSDEDYRSVSMESDNFYTQSGDGDEKDVAKVESLDLEAMWENVSEPATLFSYNVQVSTTELGGWVTVHTETDFETLGGDTYPDSGEIYIASGKRAEGEETDPDYVRLKAQGGTSAPQYFVKKEGETETVGENFTGDLSIF